MAEKHALHESDEGYAESGYENGGFKRQKLASGEAHRTYQAGGGGNPHYTDPSPVIHVRGVADEAREQDLMHALSTFGSIRYITTERGSLFSLFFSLKRRNLCLKNTWINVKTRPFISRVKPKDRSCAQLIIAK